MRMVEEVTPSTLRPVVAPTSAAATVADDPLGGLAAHRRGDGAELAVGMGAPDEPDVAEVPVEAVPAVVLEPEREHPATTASRTTARRGRDEAALAGVHVGSPPRAAGAAPLVTTGSASAVGPRFNHTLDRRSRRKTRIVSRIRGEAGS